MDELFARVAADPANLELRAVLADVLQQAGDPRGEFIALQLAIAADVDGNLVSDDARKRAASLLAAHGDAWTADLPELVAATRRFERGFLVAAHSRAPGAALTASLDRPAWATVEELAVDHTPNLVRVGKAMPLLHAFHAAHRETLVALEELGPHPNLRIVGCGGGWFPERAAFPALELLAFGVDAGAYMYLLEHRRARKLLRRAAQLDVAVAVCRAPLHQIQPLVDARADGPPELRIACEVSYGAFPGHVARGWSVRLPRGERFAELAWHGGEAFEDLRPLIQQLVAAGITDLAIGVVGSHRERARVLAARDAAWPRRPFVLTALRPR